MNGYVSTGFMIAIGRRHFRICKAGIEYRNGTKGYFSKWSSLIESLALPMGSFIFGAIAASFFI